jgi:hypothetical protein
MGSDFGLRISFGFRAAVFGFLWSCACLISGALWAQDSWQAVLARMPLEPNVRQLRRLDCVDILWRAFQPNGLVKAVILMPGATDEWYMFRPEKVDLPQANPTLLDAVSALTNQTRIRVTFRPPLLLLYTDVDVLQPLIKIEHQPTADKIEQARFLPRAVYNDRDWDVLQPILTKSLKVAMRPWRYTQDSWHFYRHSFAAYGLTGWEALEVTALAGKTTCTVKRKKVVFEVDLRLAAPPSADSAH